LLARLFARPANLLVLDEPTNDLDIDTLELLEELISEFPGTLLLVSHDRALLDHVVTGLLVIEEGRVLSWAGGYSDWAEYRDGQRARSAPAAAPAAVKPQGAAAVRKLSYKLQRELEQLPSQIEQMEQEKSALEATVQDPQFYGRPHEEVTAQLARLTALNEAIDAGMARWLELETAQRTPGSP
jgi:ATP-binding cassette subfamily F protein uup